MRASGRFDSAHLDRIRSFIVDGIKLDFKSDLPPPAKFANTPSVSGEAVFVAERLAQYLYIDAVEECEEDEIYIFAHAHAIIHIFAIQLQYICHNLGNLNSLAAGA